jgi:hypothetical protein
MPRIHAAPRSLFGRGRLAVAAVPLPLRGAALMPAAALAVHQLRYKLAFGAGSSDALAAQGHAYLGQLVPWIMLLAALSLGATLGRLAQRWASGAGARRGRLGLVGVWLTVTLALLAIYAGQELLEGMFASGHLAGLAAVFGAGGWWAVPAALLVGGVLALALRGVALAEDAIGSARLSLRLGRLRASAALTRPTMLLARARVALLAGSAAGRAPPSPCRVLV